MNTKGANDPRTQDCKVIAEAMLRLRRSCISCELFNEQTEVCQRYKQRPPARIIATGCEQFVFIPF